MFRETLFLNLGRLWCLCSHFQLWGRCEISIWRNHMLVSWFLYKFCPVLCHPLCAPSRGFNVSNNFILSKKKKVCNNFRIIQKRKEKTKHQLYTCVKRLLTKCEISHIFSICFILFYWWMKSKKPVPTCGNLEFIRPTREIKGFAREYHRHYPISTSARRRTVGQTNKYPFF